jgi:hypothetical protein
MSSRKSEAELSRIQVDTEAAWFKIKADLEANMKGIMETRLASLPGGKDGAAATAVRKEVEARLAKVRPYPTSNANHGHFRAVTRMTVRRILIFQIREDSFELAKPNLTVNGFPYETYVSTTEPWDEALDRKVWALESERVSWEATLAELRRKTPGQIREREEDLELRRARAEWLPEGEDDEGMCGHLGICSLPAMVSES